VASLRLIAIARGSGAVSRLTPSMMCNIFRSGWRQASCLDKPVKLSATVFRYVMLPATSVLMTASPIESSVRRARSPSMNRACAHAERANILFMTLDNERSKGRASFEM
jgi:hypothetical protein